MDSWNTKPPYQCFTMIKAISPGQGYGHVLWNSMCSPYMGAGMPLLMAALATQGERPKPECFAQLKYRDVTMGETNIPSGGTHSFWYVQDSSGRQWTISAGPAGDFLNGGAYSPMWQNPIDTVHDSINFWSTGLSSAVCAGVERMIEAAKQWNNGEVEYVSTGGPNSNSFTHYIGIAGGLIAPRPPGSIGWDTPIAVPRP